jgi:carboxyl-terminal processing protease
MKRFLPAALIAALALTTAGVPAAIAAPASSAVTQQQTEELAVTYAHLVEDFYQKVDRQAVLNGEREGLLGYLRAMHIVNPTLPSLRATDDESGNIREIEHELSLAVNQYGSKLKMEESLSPSTQLTYAAISGVLASVKDKYTTFLTPKQYAELNDNLDGTSFGGVGISYAPDEKHGALTIENVINDGPSDKAGLQPEDQIVAIDGTPVSQILAPAMTEKDDQKRLAAQQKIITKVLRGQPGTRVRLTISRAGKTLPVVTITRAEIHQPSVLSKMLPGEIGYIDLAVFGQTTGQELDEALKRLDAQGAKAYILDLRSNGGGYLNAAVDVSSKFIPSGPIVTVQQRAGTDTEYDAENTAIAPRPLAVLVNKYTASASEITAGAIQDSGVGTIIGEKTYGKGVVQSIWQLPDKSAIKITTARYFTPKGRDINTVGIEPEIQSPTPKDLKGFRFGDPRTDPQLVAAVSFIGTRVAQTPSTAPSSSAR